MDDGQWTMPTWEFIRCIFALDSTRTQNHTWELNIYRRWRTDDDDDDDEDNNDTL